VIGYHYTTQKAWEAIREHGLFPGHIRPHELERFQNTCGMDMPQEAVWVWKDRLTVENAWVVTALLANIHNDFDLILLKVHYKAADSIPLNYKPNPEDTVKLSCNFSVGTRDTTGDMPIDLLMNHIPPDQVEPIWEGSLLEPLEYAHVCS